MVYDASSAYPTQSPCISPAIFAHPSAHTATTTLDSIACLPLRSVRPVMAETHSRVSEAVAVGPAGVDSGAMGFHRNAVDSGAMGLHSKQGQDSGAMGFHSNKGQDSGAMGLHSNYGQDSGAMGYHRSCQDSGAMGYACGRQPPAPRRNRSGAQQGY